MKYIPLLHGTPQNWDLQRSHWKSSGGGETYYANAERLYGSQADTADFMLNLGKQYLPGAVKQYEGATSRYFDPAYEAEQVGRAVTDATTAQGNATASLKRDMASYGLNPASGRFSSMMRGNSIQGAAMTAGAANTARQNVQDKQFGAAKDFYSNLVGMPSDAASAAGSAASGYAGLGANKEAADDRSAAGWGQAIGLGASLYLKDGGEVVKKSGIRMARGGLLPRDSMPPPQPRRAPSTSGGAGTGAVQGFSTGRKLKDAMTGGASDKLLGGASKGMAGLADLTGSTALGETAMGAAGAGAEQAGMMAMQNAGLEGATAATVDALGAGTAAAGEAAAAASPLMAGVASVVPWIGAAVAVGSMFDLFADGGEVKSRKVMTRGGEVDGPGTETSDDVPAWLSDGEYVLNAEAVDMVGKKKLDQINRAGLEKRGDRGAVPMRAKDGAVMLSLGSFVGGLAGGYTTGERIKEHREDRKFLKEERDYQRGRRAKEDAKEARREKLSEDYGLGMEKASYATNTAEDGMEQRTAIAAMQDDAAFEALKNEDARYRQGRPKFAESVGLDHAPARRHQDPETGVETFGLGEVSAQPLQKTTEIGQPAQVTQQKAPGAVGTSEFQPITQSPAQDVSKQPIEQLRAPKMDADYLFYTSMWPKLRGRYATEYGMDKAMDMDGKLLEAADRNHQRRMLEAARLNAAGDKAGTVRKLEEVFARDMPDGTFAKAELSQDGNQVTYVIFDMSGKVVQKQTMPYDAAVNMAMSSIGDATQQIKTILAQDKEVKDRAYYAEMGGAKTADDAAKIAAKYGKDPIAARSDMLGLEKTQADIANIDADNKHKSATLGETIRHNKASEGLTSEKNRLDASAGGFKPTEHMSRLKYGTEQLQLMYGVRVDPITGRIDGSLADKQGYMRAIGELERRVKSGEEPGNVAAELYDRDRRGQALSGDGKGKANSGKGSPAVQDMRNRFGY